MALDAQSEESFGLERDDPPPTFFRVILHVNQFPEGIHCGVCPELSFFFLIVGFAMVSFILYSLGHVVECKNHCKIGLHYADQFLLCWLDRDLPNFYKMNCKK